MVSRVPPRYGFGALGGLCAGLGLRHLVFGDGGTGPILESALILSLSAVAFYTAHDLSRWELTESGRWRAVRISALAAASFAALAGIVWLIWLLDHHAFKLSFLLTFAASLGAAVGSRGSLYAVKADEQLTEAQELATLLSINDRVLRHNLRNELSVALGYLDGIEGEDREEIADRAGTVRDHLKDLVETSERTRRIASIWRTDTLHSTDLVSVVTERVAQLNTEESEATVRTDLPDDCVVRAHPALPLAIEEALRNAVEHNPEGVTIAVRLRRRDDGDVALDIADTGRGIPPNERRTLRNAEETPLEHTEGLGLWMIYWAVTRSGGTVAFEENEPRGTVVRIRLPGSGVTNGSEGDELATPDPADTEETG